MKNHIFGGKYSYIITFLDINFAEKSHFWNFFYSFLPKTVINTLITGILQGQIVAFWFYFR